MKINLIHNSKQLIYYYVIYLMKLKRLRNMHLNNRLLLGLLDKPATNDPPHGLIPSELQNH